VLSKFVALSTVFVLIGYGTKSLDNPSPASEGRQKAAIPAGSDNAKIAPEVTLPEETKLRVRLDEALDTRRNRAGDSFTAAPVEPVVVGGETVVPKGTKFRGHIAASGASGRLKGVRSSRSH
jgi:hypothetical protein